MSEPMAKRVVREVVRSVVQRTSTDGTTPSALKSAADPADKVNARSRRAPSYLARRGYTYYFQIRPPLALAPCKLSRRHTSRTCRPAAASGTDSERTETDFLGFFFGFWPVGVQPASWLDALATAIYREKMNWMDAGRLSVPSTE